MVTILNILSTLQQKIKTQPAGQPAKGLEQKELEDLKATYSKQGVNGKTVDRTNGFLVRLLESDPNLVTKDDFISDFKAQLKKPFVDLILDFDKCMPGNINKSTGKEKDDCQNSLNKILEWIAENKTIELYDLVTKISSMKKPDEKLTHVSNFLEEMKREIPDDMKLECILMAKTFKAQELGLKTIEVLEKAADIKEKYKPTTPAKDKSVMPIVGMVISGVVGLFGLYKSVNSDEKNLPYGLTILGLIGFSASAVWKWGWPKGGGTPSHISDTGDDDMMMAAAAVAGSGAAMDGHGDSGFGFS